MRTSTLLKSSLIAAGLLLGGISVAHADSDYSIILHGGDFHPYAGDYRSCRHAPGWHTGYRHYNGHRYGYHDKLHGKHHKGHHGSSDRDGRHSQRDHWQHGKLGDRSDGGHHVHQPRAAGIGYTGRS